MKKPLLLGVPTLSLPGSCNKKEETTFTDTHEFKPEFYDLSNNPV